MRKGKSAAAIVVGRGGKNVVIARRNLALESGNITSSKRAARLPLKWRSAIRPLKKYRYPHLSEARKLKEFVLSENGLKKYME
jgi:predicted secreted hydrolase